MSFGKFVKKHYVYVIGVPVGMAFGIAVTELFGGVVGGLSIILFCLWLNMDRFLADQTPVV